MCDDDDDDEDSDVVIRSRSSCEVDDASALREFQARLLANQPQIAAPEGLHARRGSGGRRHTLCLSR